MAVVFVPDFLYPREGTETARLYMTGAIKLGIFFIPARGRKQVKYDLGLAPDIDFLYPREGPPFPTKIDIFAIHLFTNSA